MKRILPYFLVLMSMVLSACVGPQEITLIEREQRRLRLENTKMRKDLDNVRSHLADSRASFEEMQTQLTALREKAEEVRHHFDRQIGQSNLQGGQRVTDLEARIARMDDELRAQAAHLNAREQELQVLREAVIRATGGGAELATFMRREPEGTQKEPIAGPSDLIRSDYEEAWKSLERKNYRDAITQFNGFIKKHPKSDYADNAQYWIGESYYALKAFDQAILEFDSVRRKYPNGDKVPAALLKQGFAFAELGDKVDARLILQELIARYPQSQEAVKAKQKVKSLES